MDEDFDEELLRALEELEEEKAMGVPQPTYRATVKGERLQLVHHGPRLVTGGPLATLFTGVEEAGFKGLESPVVVLSELEDIDDETIDQQLYVGFSRARNHCIVVAPEAQPT